MSKGFWLEQGYKINKETGEIDWEKGNPEFYKRKHVPFAGFAAYRFGSRQSKDRKQHRSKLHQLNARRSAQKAARQRLAKETKNELDELVIM